MCFSLSSSVWSGSPFPPSVLGASWEQPTAQCLPASFRALRGRRAHEHFTSVCRQRQTWSKNPLKAASGPAVRAQLKDQAGSSGIWALPSASSTPTAGISTRETLRALGSLPCPEFRGIHSRRGRQVPGEQHRGSSGNQSQVRAQVGHVSPCVVAWHMGLDAAMWLSEQRRAAQDCDSNAGTQTMGFRDFFEIQVTALSQNSTG